MTVRAKALPTGDLRCRCCGLRGRSSGKVFGQTLSHAYCIANAFPLPSFLLFRVLGLSRLFIPHSARGFLKQDRGNMTILVTLVVSANLAKLVLFLIAVLLSFEKKNGGINDI